jgi:hypothetical protein
VCSIFCIFSSSVTISRRPCSLQKELAALHVIRVVALLEADLRPTHLTLFCPLLSVVPARLASGFARARGACAWITRQSRQRKHISRVLGREGPRRWHRNDVARSSFLQAHLRGLINSRRVARCERCIWRWWSPLWWLHTTLRYGSLHMNPFPNVQRAIERPPRPSPWRHRRHLGVVQPFVLRARWSGGNGMAEAKHEIPACPPSVSGPLCPRRHSWRSVWCSDKSVLALCIYGRR